jgi:phosphoenolpyruvate-protein kinase (PTS system EI component)
MDRLVAAVAGNGFHGPTRPAPAIAVAAHGARAILVAQEITADDLLVHSGTVVGAVTVLGSATSHAGILARTLGVPMAFGTDAAILDAQDGVDTLLDPSTGEVVLNPAPYERRAGHQWEVARAASAGGFGRASARSLPLMLAEPDAFSA